MNKLCVIAKNKETHFIKRLIEEVGEKELSFFNPWADFEIPQASLYLCRTSGVYKSDLDLLIMKSLSKGQLINPFETLKIFRSKPSQFSWFEDNNFPILPWFSLKETDALTIEKFFVLYPRIIVKPHVGQGGWGVETLKKEEFNLWWKRKQREKDLDYLIQPLVKGATEYRYFFMKGEAPIILKREAFSGVSANFKQNGSAIVSTLPPELEEILRAVAQKSEAFYGAIDLFVDHNRLFILELNTSPGIEQLEQVSGINVMARLLGSWTKT